MIKQQVFVACSLRELVMRACLLCLLIVWAPLAFSDANTDITPKNAAQYGIKVSYQATTTGSDHKVIVTFPKTRPAGIKGFATIQVAYAGQNPKKDYQLVRAPQYAGMAMALGPIAGLRKTFVVIVYELSGAVKQVLTVPLDPWLPLAKDNSAH